MKAESRKQQKCNCARCGVECEIRARRTSNAQLLKRSKKPSGVCSNCAVTEWFMNTYPINMQLDGSGPAALLQPFMQKHFANIMKAGGADMDPAEIDWQKVVGNWNLPVEVERSATNPYIPGIGEGGNQDGVVGSSRRNRKGRRSGPARSTKR